MTTGPGLNALLARIEDLEDVMSVYEARADGRSIPRDAVKAAAGLPLSQYSRRRRSRFPL